MIYFFFSVIACNCFVLCFLFVQLNTKIEKLYSWIRALERAVDEMENRQIVFHDKIYNGEK